MKQTPTKPEESKYEVALVKKLLELKQKEDRGVLAALRTGLGKPPGTAARMFPTVAPFLQANEGPTTQAAFLTAALFASHSEHADIGSLGASLLKTTKRDEANPSGKHNEAGVEARFAAALDAHPEDLPRHLEGLVSLCESAGVPIDWHRFYWDVRTLVDDDEDKRTKTRIRWARDFWQGPRNHETPQVGEEETEE